MRKVGYLMQLPSAPAWTRYGRAMGCNGSLALQLFDPHQIHFDGCLVRSDVAAITGTVRVTLPSKNVSVTESV